jgi:hypothetical protein
MSRVCGHSTSVRYWAYCTSESEAPRGRHFNLASDLFHTECQSGDRNWISGRCSSFTLSTHQLVCDVDILIVSDLRFV